MNKKWLLGIGGIAAVSLPVSTIVACGDKNSETPSDDGKSKNSSDGKKSASVSTGSIENISSAIVGSNNAYTLSFVSPTDTANKATIEKRLKAMVSKATNDTAKISFTGTWDTEFDASKNVKYTYTVKAEGYKDVTFAITVTGNTAVDTSSTSGTSAKGDIEDKFEQDATKNKETDAADKAKQELATAKTTATGLVDDLAKKLVMGTKGNTDLFQKMGAAAAQAETDITNATTKEAVEAIAKSSTEGSGIEAILAVISAYNKSKGTDAADQAKQELATAKATATGLVDALVKTAPKTDSLQNATLFNAIATAVDKAKDDISKASNKAAVETIASSNGGTGIEAIQAKIDAYTQAKETADQAAADQAAADQAKQELATAKATATGLVDALVKTAPKTDSLQNATLFNAIATAVDKAKDDISKASNKAAVETIASSNGGTGIEAIQAKIDAYTQAKEAADQAAADQAAADQAKQELATAKATATGLVDALVKTAPKTDSLQNPTLFSAITSAATTAKTDITNAATKADVEKIAKSSTEGSGIEAIQAKIDAYTQAKAAADQATADQAAADQAKQELATAKTTATGFVDALVKTAPKTNSLQNPTLFSAITSAAATAKTDITNAATKADVEKIAKSSTEGSGIEAIQAAIDAYTQAKAAADKAATDQAKQALATAKTNAKAFVNGLSYPQKDDGAHDAAKFAAIAIAKKAAIAAIDAATTAQNATAMASSATVGSELTKVTSAIDDYNKSTVTAVADKATTKQELDAAKKIADGFAHKWSIKNVDGKLHDAALFNAIKSVLKTARDNIKNATTKAAVEAIAKSPTEGSGIEAIIEKMDNYFNSTGTIKDEDKRVEKAKSNAKGILKILNSHVGTGGNPDIYAEIKAKINDSEDKIKNAKTVKEVESLVRTMYKGTESSKIADLVKKYKASKKQKVATGTSTSTTK